MRACVEKMDVLGWNKSISLQFKDFFIPLQSDGTMNYDPQKYFLNFPISHLNVAPFVTKICLDFSSGDTVDL